MIGLIEGRVCHLAAPVACIMTNAGVGYEVELPLPDFCQLQMEASVMLWTHLHVREDAQLLFGFLNIGERDVFRQLIRINGVGAKMALAMMSTMSASELKHSVESDNEAALTRVPGIGKKTAQRLLIELKGKFDHIENDTDLLSTVNTETMTQQGKEGVILAEVESALISLGYRDKEAQQAIKAARETDAGQNIVDTQSLLKLTLQQLSNFK
ncbi:Holliday junction branch migration protein RuvA [Psychrobacter sp. FDAARGOS_221]|uniref:Holliday junction branch migration protein RuvA n=1 Tax=Psychrobacter sp. FDAARGOS_221 TaxID=1975705 RepID=UPI000BB568D4|nr:Holliday junction branch migration protein RuvA [Psychrobacter sp. FDAARGOS_221]PNK59743.1 Holliday junction branch migration protein RuvA [Psychrobacter sp. FDAARGOS_221]